MIELVTGEVGIKKLDVGDDLLVYWNSGEHSRFSFIWLRDNARDEASFDARSHQRRVFTAGLDPEIAPDSTRLVERSVRIKWPDMDREVSYPVSFLHEYRGVEPVSRDDVQTWAAEFQAPSNDFGTLGESHNTLLESIRRYGVSVVTGCPRESSSVVAIAAEIGYVRQTIFGGIWSFEADAARDDSAYSTEALRPHTDGTYSFDPPGLQILLCMEKDGEGAESILVDDRLFNDPANQWRYTLSVGEALVIDNWRILHGRTEFSGKRKMAGAYVNREDLESRLITRINDA